MAWQVDEVQRVFQMANSVPNSLHVFEQNLLTAAVIELRRPAIGVAGDTLSGFKGAVIFKKIGDTGCLE